jgi:hypothetical protein
MLSEVARIRIVDEWLRSPVSPPSRYRAIMVVADSWGEQRVLMRSFADSPDQTRPTIVLHGAELAIGPAGTDPHGPWGIHVQPPADGRAQELREQLEIAAQRLAGSKGTPPRLQDEVSAFERKRTNNWAPGTPREEVSAAETHHGPGQAAAQAPVPPSAYGHAAPPPAQPQAYNYYEPAAVAPPVHSPVIPSAAPRQSNAQTVPAEQGVQFGRPPVVPAPPTPPAGYRAIAPTAPVAPLAHGRPKRNTANPLRVTPVPGPANRHTPRRGWTSPVRTAPAREVGSTTAMGFTSGAGAQSPEMRWGAAPPERLAKVVGHTLPVGFHLTPPEREVLNMLGEVDSLTASRVAEIVGVPNGIGWMDKLMSKLADHGLDLIAPGDDDSGEPSYVLRR